MGKNVVYIMYQESLGFLSASNFLKKTIYNNGINLLSCSPAYTVNQTFACELLLKALCKINKVEYSNSHKLRELLSKLPQGVVSEIEQEYDLLCKKYLDTCNNNIELRKMNQCLESYDNAFVDWRYYYENSKKDLKLPWKDFEIFIVILRKMVEKDLNLHE